MPAAHKPPAQMAPSATLECWQPLTSSQASVVHTFASSQLMALPTHLPPLQVSALLQTEPSSQAAALFTVWQPFALSQ